MESYNDPQHSGKDPLLWEIAKRRASFKNHVRTYVVVIGFLWALWLFTGSAPGSPDKYPWPIWPTGGWGIGLLFHYIGAYVSPKENSAENEYEKLVRGKR